MERIEPFLLLLAVHMFVAQVVVSGEALQSMVAAALDVEGGQIETVRAKQMVSQLNNLR